MRHRPGLPGAVIVVARLVGATPYGAGRWQLLSRISSGASDVALRLAPETSHSGWRGGDESSWGNPYYALSNYMKTSSGCVPIGKQQFPFLWTLQLHLCSTRNLNYGHQSNQLMMPGPHSLPTKNATSQLQLPTRNRLTRTQMVDQQRKAYICLAVPPGWSDGTPGPLQRVPKITLRSTQQNNINSSTPKRSSISQDWIFVCPNILKIKLPSRNDHKNTKEEIGKDPPINSVRTDKNIAIES